MLVMQNFLFFFIGCVYLSGIGLSEPSFIYLESSKCCASMQMELMRFSFWLLQQ